MPCILNDLSRAQIAEIQQRIEDKKVNYRCLTCAAPFLEPSPKRKYCNLRCKNSAAYSRITSLEQKIIDIERTHTLLIEELHKDLSNAAKIIKQYRDAFPDFPLRI